MILGHPPRFCNLRILAVQPRRLSSPPIPKPSYLKGRNAVVLRIASRLAYRIKEAAEVLDIPESSVRRLIGRGEIRANRKLRHILIPPAELERFMDLKN